MRARVQIPSAPPVGLWRSWERTALAARRAWVRDPPGPPIGRRCTLTGWAYTLHMCVAIGSNPIPSTIPGGSSMAERENRPHDLYTNCRYPLVAQRQSACLKSRGSQDRNLPGGPVYAAQFVSVQTPVSETGVRWFDSIRCNQWPCRLRWSGRVPFKHKEPDHHRPGSPAPS